ncbi:MAG: bifunctional 5,10-methylenetetrahydrofolate dehydrogenase/5,10-methenyltetrahydrofolate cyclohydrolase [Candidatus Saccharimonas sp.]
MTRELNGAELVSFIKERQAKQVRNLKQEHHIHPKLVVLMSESASDTSEVYVRMKQRYAEDVGIEVEIMRSEEDSFKSNLEKYNNDSNIHGIIVQLPLKNSSQTQAICDKIDSNKDVDGLGSQASFVSATAEAINWLLVGYNVELKDKKIAIVGYGKLVGRPLEELFLSQGRDVTVVDIDTEDSRAILSASDIIVSAAGVPGRITSADVKPKGVVVDAGTASEGGVLVGDVAPDVRERDDITITPVKGGVGPLTIAVLFDHVIQSALRLALTK